MKNKRMAILGGLVATAVGGALVASLRQRGAGRSGKQRGAGAQRRGRADAENRMDRQNAQVNGVTRRNSQPDHAESGLNEAKSSLSVRFG